MCFLFANPKTLEQTFVLYFYPKPPDPFVLNTCNALLFSAVLPFSLRALADASLARKLQWCPPSLLGSPAGRCSGSRPHQLSSLPCTYPNCLAHCDLNVCRLHGVWLKPFSYSDPSAQNVQRDPVEIPPILQRPVICHYFLEPSPGPIRSHLYLLFLIQSTPFVLVYLEHSSLD